MATGLFTLKQVNQAVRQTAWTTGVKTTAVDYLVVAGGGGAGAGDPGGGGAGGLLQGSVPVVTGSAITVTVGAGGAGRSGATVPGSGTASVFGSLSAVGGGYGATSSTPGGSGGSGGGAGTSTASVFGEIGQGTFNQGNQGGIGSTSAGGQAGGGGGAGTRGGYNSNGAGDGGTGVASVISGTVTAYAGGGGGSGSGTSGRGGAGGGGAGATGTNGTSGTANTGGGGGGANSYTGGSGGSGIVVVSYPDTFAAAASTTGSPTISTSGSGSISFNGTTQHLNYGDSTAFEFGLGDFTIETFIYVNSLTPGGSIIGKYRIADLAASEFFFGYSSAGALSLYLCSTVPSNDETGFVSANGVITAGSWIHVAATRASGAVKLFVNGSVVTSGTYNKTITATSSSLRISALTNTSNDYSNFINASLSNVRIVKGTALYTGTFTVPTAPLTVVSGTSLLLSSVSGAYLTDSSTNGFNPLASATALNSSVAGPWNAASPFTVTGYKNRVYTWTSSGSITF
jgi:hypothetical protein